MYVLGTGDTVVQETESLPSHEQERETINR